MEVLNMKWTIIAASFVVLLSVLFAFFYQPNRFVTVNAGEGIMYKLDQNTGKTYMVTKWGEREVPKIKSYEERQKDKQQSIERELEDFELEQLTGRAGLRSGNYFAGNVYNGNPNLRVTEIYVAVGTKPGWGDNSRIYRDIVSLDPFSSCDFGFDIVTSEPGQNYGWAIVNAIGEPVDLSP
jgi:hypothetical protein